ncbi:EamA family transporter [Tsukamurella sp. 8F]|uniref:DMT family transporter n=1 Tax=unclassified Tsukamurella TaxID=2633480 RepID=UPI0023BA2806|nr:MULTISPECIES: EamA family transporter [unclassified Tsukamurella]MDF0531497.1 EamA family transporter [Tsukamurella sp. 8J]MDF0588741.1 EamA family transporter [Tsukamurella sp. 8F]
MSRVPLPALALAAVMLMWSSSFVVIRHIVAFVEPAPMAEGRLLVGSVVLVTLWSWRFRSRVATALPRGRTLWLTVGYGALWFALYTVLVNAAEQHLDAGTTALLVNIAPIVVAVLAGTFLREGFPPLLVVGIAVSFAGAAVIALAGPGRHDMLGVALAVVAALLYGISVVAQKLVLRDADALTATALGCLVGALVLLPYAPRLWNELAAGPVSATVGVVYLGLAPTALAFLLWAYALAHTPAGVTASSSYAVPALSILGSWAFLSETPSAVGLAGGALCLAGVAIARLPRRRRRAVMTGTDIKATVDVSD